MMKRMLVQAQKLFDLEERAQCPLIDGCMTLSLDGNQDFLFNNVCVTPDYKMCPAYKMVYALEVAA